MMRDNQSQSRVAFISFFIITFASSAIMYAQEITDEIVAAAIEQQQVRLLYEQYASLRSERVYNYLGLVIAPESEIGFEHTLFIGWTMRPGVRGECLVIFVRRINGVLIVEDAFGQQEVDDCIVYGHTSPRSPLSDAQVDGLQQLRCVDEATYVRRRRELIDKHFAGDPTPLTIDYVFNEYSDNFSAFAETMIGWLPALDAGLLNSLRIAHVLRDDEKIENSWLQPRDAIEAGRSVYLIPYQLFSSLFGYVRNEPYTSLETSSLRIPVIDTVEELEWLLNGLQLNPGKGDKVEIALLDDGKETSIVTYTKPRWILTPNSRAIRVRRVIGDLDGGLISGLCTLECDSGITIIAQTKNGVLHGAVTEYRGSQVSQLGSYRHGLRHGSWYHLTSDRQGGNLPLHDEVYQYGRLKPYTTVIYRRLGLFDPRTKPIAFTLPVFESVRQVTGHGFPYATDAEPEWTLTPFTVITVDGEVIGYNGEQFFHQETQTDRNELTMGQLRHFTHRVPAYVTFDGPVSMWWHQNGVPKGKLEARYNGMDQTYDTNAYFTGTMVFDLHFDETKHMPGTEKLEPPGRIINRTPYEILYTRKPVTMTPGGKINFEPSLRVELRRGSTEWYDLLGKLNNEVDRFVMRNKDLRNLFDDTGGVGISYTSNGDDSDWSLNIGNDGQVSIPLANPWRDKPVLEMEYGRVVSSRSPASAADGIATELVAQVSKKTEFSALSEIITEHQLPTIQASISEDLESASAELGERRLELSIGQVKFLVGTFGPEGFGGWAEYNPMDPPEPVGESYVNVYRKIEAGSDTWNQPIVLEREASQRLAQARKDFVGLKSSLVADHGTLAWGDRVSPEFRQRVREMARRLGVDPNHLMTIMAFETGGSFSPAQRTTTGSAVGLIQFIESTSIALGFQPGEHPGRLASMSAEEQLTYVERYFTINNLQNKMPRMVDMYFAVLGRTDLSGSDSSVVIFSNPSREYLANKWLDKEPKDGAITVREVESFLDSWLARGHELKNRSGTYVRVRSGMAINEQTGDPVRMSISQSAEFFCSTQFNKNGYLGRDATLRNGGLSASAFTVATMFRYSYGDKWVQQYAQAWDAGLRPQQLKLADSLAFIGVRKRIPVASTQLLDSERLEEAVIARRIQAGEYVFEFYHDNEQLNGLITIHNDGSASVHTMIPTGLPNGGVFHQGDFHKWYERTVGKNRQIYLYHLQRQEPIKPQL